MAKASDSAPDEPNKELMEQWAMIEPHGWRWTPLHKAAFYNHKESHWQHIENLLKQGANVNEPDDYGRTPFHKLVRFASPRLIQLLLDYRADVHVRDNNGETPLFDVFRSADMNIIQLLLDHGANIFVRSNDGSTLLHEMFKVNRYASHLEVMEFLLDSGASVNARDYRGRVPVHHLRDTDERTLKFILTHGFEIDVQDNDGKTPLINAIRSRNLELVKFLVEHGSNVNNKNVHGEVWCKTPLHWAYRCESVKILRFLLKNGADANEADFDDYTLPTRLLKSFSESSNTMNVVAGFAMLPVLLDYTDFGVRNLKFTHFFANYNLDSPHLPREMVVKHLAKLLALDLPVHPIFYRAIVPSYVLYDVYLETCEYELEIAKIVTVPNCSVTYFELLIDGKDTVKDCTEYENLISNFDSRQCLRKFLIYGRDMVKNLHKGIKRRELFEKSIAILSGFSSAFDPTESIVTDVLNLLTPQDYKILVSK